MKPAGLKEAEAAKADGRWEAAYDGQASISLPADFLEELSKNKIASDFYESLNNLINMLLPGGYKRRKGRKQGINGLLKRFWKC